MPRNCAVGAAGAVAAGVAGAATFDMTITADNYYTVFVGDATGPTTVVGSGLNPSSATLIFQAEQYTFTATDYIYIAAWNQSGPLGLVFDLVQQGGGDFSSGSPLWEVALLDEVGRGTLAHTVSEINALLADPNTGPFTTQFVGDNNDNSNDGPRPVFPQVGAISQNASWVWADVAVDPFASFSRQTVLFRLQVPAPGAAGLLLFGAATCLRRRDR